MPDVYQNSAYRNEAAKRKAGLSKPGASQGFVAPGYPAEVMRPVGPPVPPGVAGAAAAGGAGGAAVAGVAGAAVAVGGGLALGASVKQDIDKFKKLAKSPWYDTDYAYRPGKGMKVHYDESKWKGVIPDFDLAEDLAIRQRHAELIDEWVEAAQKVGGDFPGFYRFVDPAYPDGWKNPDYNYFRCPNQFPHLGVEYNANGAFSGCPGTEFFPTTAYPHVTGITRNNPGDVMLAALPGRPTINGFHQRVVDPTRGRLSHQFGYTGAAGGTGVFSEALVHVAFAEPGMGYGTPLKPSWYDGVAEPGTQPGEPARAPHGVYVPQLFTYRFQVMPGYASVPVTVPDQVIRPGAPQPSPGAIAPPGHAIPPGATAPGSMQPPHKKVNVRNIGFASGVWLAGNFLTESFDFVHSLYMALPKKYRKPGKATPTEKWRAVTKHWKHVDAAKAVENYVNNEIEDMFYGQIGRQGNKASRTFGISTGVGGALSRARNQANEAAGQKVVLPEVHWADGEFTISYGEWELTADPLMSD